MTSELVSVSVRRGDIVWVDLRGAVGTEKQKKRPCVVVQNDTGNLRSPLTIVVPLTDTKAWRSYPQQVFVEASELADGLKDSVVDCGHVRSVDKQNRIDGARGVVAHLSDATMKKVDDALRASLGLKTQAAPAWPDAVSINLDDASAQTAEKLSSPPPDGSRA